MEHTQAELAGTLQVCEETKRLRTFDRVHRRHTQLVQRRLAGQQRRPPLLLPRPRPTLVPPVERPLLQHAGGPAPGVALDCSAPRVVTPADSQTPHRLRVEPARVQIVRDQRHRPTG